MVVLPRPVTVCRVSASVKVAALIVITPAVLPKVILVPALMSTVFAALPLKV